MSDVTVALKTASGQPGLSKPEADVEEVLVTGPAGTVVKFNGVQVNP